MNQDIKAYHDALPEEYRAIADALYNEICSALPEAMATGGGWRCYIGLHK